MEPQILVTKNDSVTFKVFTPAMMVMLNKLFELSQYNRNWFVGALVITSANDGKHMKTSRHYKDEALDVRTHNWSVTPNRSKAFIMGWLQTQLGPKFTVMLEDEGTPNEHCHIQVKKGTVYKP